MSAARQCACGYAGAGADDLLDHLLEVFTPDDDRAPDGVIHAEAAAAGGGGGKRSCSFVCLCGAEASGIREMDSHFLAAFVPPGGIAADGRQHAAYQGDGWCQPGSRAARDAKLPDVPRREF